MSRCSVLIAALSLAGMLCLWPVSRAYAEVVVVVSTNNPTPPLNSNEVGNLFLGRSRRFPDGRDAVPIDHAQSSPVREEFYVRFLSKSPAQMRAHWSKIIFTGRGQPPKQLDSDVQVRAAIAADPRLIGYLDSAQVDETVRVVGRP